MLRWKLLSFLIVLLMILISYETTSSESSYKLPYPAGKEYKVTQENFGAKSHNLQVDQGKAIYAFDFNLRDGYPVVASRSGKVLSVQDKFERGKYDSNYASLVNYVLIDHGDGTSTLYLHLQKDSIVVKEGEDVKQGQVIGKADSSGYITGPHLHFQVQVTPKKIWYDSSKGYNRGWYTQSIQISFSDKDVLAKEPDGIPQERKSHISDNVAPLQTSKIAYIASSSLYLINSDGTDQIELPSGTGVLNFEWLPDGKKIIYNRGGLDFEGVFLINTETGEEVKILEGKPFLKLSPDGKKFLYWEGDLWNESLALFDLGTKSSEILLIQQTYRRLELGYSLGVNSLIWSPDGKKLAYIDNNYVDAQGLQGTAIWRINLDTLEKEIIWENTLGSVGNPISISWSPDGQKIGLVRLLTRQGLGNLTYDLLDIHSRSFQTVMDITYEPRFCGGVLPDLMDVYWIKESAKVALSFPEDCWKITSAIVKVEPTLSSPGLWLFEENKEPKLLSELSGYNGIDISPDGTSLIFSGGPPLYTVNIDGTNLRRIAELGSIPVWQPIQR